MPGENKETPGTSGGSPGTGAKGNGQDSGVTLESIATNIKSMGGIVEGLATKVASMEQVSAETRELEEIMRGVPEPTKEPEKTEPISKDASADVFAKAVIGEVNKVLDDRFGDINNRIGNLNAQLDIARQEKDPEFTPTLRPLAAKLAKEPGKERWDVNQLTEHARGRVAVQLVAEQKKQLETNKAEIDRLTRLLPDGDRPSVIGIGGEAPKVMTEDESYDDAAKEAGLDHLV